MGRGEVGAIPASQSAAEKNIIIINHSDLKFKFSTADRPTSNEEAKDLGKIEMIEAFSAWRHFSYGWTEAEV